MDAARTYLAIAAALDRHLPGSLTGVDAASTPRSTPAALVREAGTLAAALSALSALSASSELSAELPPERAAFLAAQVDALEVTARRLAGQRFDVAEEMSRTYGVRVGPGEPDTYRAAHRELDALLPGSGPLPPRLLAYRDHDPVPPARLGAVVRALSEELRALTAARIGLPDGEQVTYRFVDEAPWGALHRDDGVLRSVVTINAGGSRPTRRRPTQLARLVAHEAYPGHHTERCRKAVGLVARGWVEHAATLTCSPQSTIAEGTAEIGLRALVGPGWGRWTQDVVAEVGVRCDGELAQRIDDALALLAPVRLDAALMLHERPSSPDADGAAAHLRRWALADAPGVAQTFRFLHHPVWRIYVAASVAGPALVGRWWRAQPDDARLRRLLDEPLTPSDLSRAIAPHAVTRSG